MWTLILKKDINELIYKTETDSQILKTNSQILKTNLWLPEWKHGGELN